MFFSPRWGLHGNKFIPFEKEKWNFFLEHFKSKETILSKFKYFPNHTKYFGIEKNSYDGNLYLSAMSYLCNLAITNRIYLGSIVKSFFNKKLNIKDFSLVWDCVHDSIKEEKIKNSSRIIHRHGAAPTYDQEYIKKNLNNNLNYRHVIIPSKPGGETLLAFSKKNVKNFFHSICHGTGRLLDRPMARKKFSHKLTKKEISKKINKLYYKMDDLSGENPKSFRSINQVIKILEKRNLIKKLYLTKPLYILKS